MKPILQRSLFEDQEALAEREPEPSSLRAATPAVEIVRHYPSPSVHRAPPPTPQEWMACVKVDDCDWVAFLRKNGRVPHLTDAKKPWEYPGWLMYYRVLAEDHLNIPKRWDYWFRTMIAGHLLDEPIPQMHFTGGGGERSEGYKLLDQWIHLIDRYGGGWSSPMTVLLDWLLWGFCLSADKPSLSAELNEQLYRSVNIGPLLLEPHDYFGEWIANQKGKWNPGAFYPTPEHVVELMVQINFSGVDWKQARSMTVCDPCMGSGRMLLLSAGYSLRLFGVDIDAEVLRAAKVNGALYAPWLVRPFSDHFFVEREGPSPTEKIATTATRTETSNHKNRKR